MPRLPILLASALLAATAGAQSVILYNYAPPGYGTVEGTAQSQGPFGLNARVRIQCLYHGQAVKVRTASRIAMRGNGGVIHAGNRQVELEILAGGSPNDPFSMQQTFSANHGPDFGVVFQRKRVDLPPLTGQTPQDFDIEFALDSPMSRLTSPHVLVEFVVYDWGQSSPGYHIDAAGFDTQQISTTGTNCNAVSLLTAGSVQPSGGGLSLFMSSPAFTFGGGVGLVLLGTAPLPAPVPLPGGCQLHQNIALTAAVPLDASGSSQLMIPLPPWSKGLQLQTQLIAADAALTTLGSSASTHLTVGGAEAAASSYSRSFSHMAGPVSHGIVPVLRFKS